MTNVQMNYFTKDVENMTAHDAFLAGWEAFQKEEHRKNWLKKKLRTFNPYDFTVKDERIPHPLQGVHYSNGHSYATNKYVALRIRENYDAALEGKTIGRDGMTIAVNDDVPASFPNIDRMIPDDSELSPSDLTFEDFRAARSVSTSRAYLKLKEIKVDMGDGKFNLSTIDLVVKFWSAYPDARLLKNPASRRPWKLTDDGRDAQLIFMPQIEVDDCRYRYDRGTKLCLCKADH